MTGHDLIHSAARAINYIAPGEELPGTDVQDGLTVLNAMLDAWAAERLLIFTLARQVFNFIAGLQTYTAGLGTGTNGNLNIPRPPKIEYWSPISNANPALPIELESGSLLTDEEWKEVRSKNTTSPIPRELYDDGSFPARNLSFYPIPTDSSVQFALYTWTALSQFTDLVTDHTFPPGYLEAVKYQLAVRLSAEWPGTVLTPQASELARSSLARIKSFNAPIVKLKIDSALTGQGRHYDWRVDEEY